jgi:hypothetical protein
VGFSLGYFHPRPNTTLILLPLMRLHPVLALLTSLIAITGCHSPYVVTTVSNHTTQPIALLEVDYPSASFGTENLAPGADFHYRFKVLGSGNMKLLYTDSTHQDHKSDGLFLKEGAQGTLAIVIADTGVTWQPAPTVASSK